MSFPHDSFLVDILPAGAGKALSPQEKQELRRASSDTYTTLSNSDSDLSWQLCSLNCSGRTNKMPVGTGAAKVALLKNFLANHTPDLLFIQEWRWSVARFPRRLVEISGMGDMKYSVLYSEPGSGSCINGLVSRLRLQTVPEAFWDSHLVEQFVREGKGQKASRGLAEQARDRLRVALFTPLANAQCWLVSVHAPHTGGSALPFVKGTIHNVVTCLRSRRACPVIFVGDFNYDISTLEFGAGWIVHMAPWSENAEDTRTVNDHILSYGLQMEEGQEEGLFSIRNAMRCKPGSAMSSPGVTAAMDPQHVEYALDHPLLMAHLTYTQT